MTTPYTENWQEIRSAYVKLLDPNGTGGVGIHEAVDLHMSFIEQEISREREEERERILKILNHWKTETDKESKLVDDIYLKVKLRNI